MRVFYALGDGETPFRVSIFNIVLNFVLDYLLYKPFATQGIVLATVAVNITSMAIFLWILHRRLNGLPLGEWGIALLQLTAISAIAGLGSWGVSWQWQEFFGDSNLWLQLIRLCLAVTVCLGIFAILVIQLKLPEVTILQERILQKVRRS